MIKIQTLTIVPKIFTSPLECKAPDMITFFRGNHVSYDYYKLQYN